MRKKTMPELTTAEGFELVGGEADEINRWSKKGDRLYVNGIKGYDVYVDLETDTVEDVSNRVDATLEVDGDTMTLTLTSRKYDTEWATEIAIDWGETEDEEVDDSEEAAEPDIETVPAEDPDTLELADELEEGAEVLVNDERKTVKRLARRQIDFVGGGRADYSDVEVIVGETADDNSDDDADADEQDAESEPEVVADGGDDGATEHVADRDIQQAIEQHDDPEHPDACTIPEVRETLAAVNADVVDWWSEALDTVDEGGYEIVHEDRKHVVLADHTGHMWTEHLDALDIEDGILRHIVKQVHHSTARRLCDYDWSTSDPVVVRKPEAWRTGEEHALRRIAQFARESGGGIGRGVDRYATEVANWQQQQWAKATDRHRNAVGKNVRRGREAGEQ